VTVIFRTALSERVQLAPQSIMPGESISSLVDRQAQLWGLSRRNLVDQLASFHGLLARRDLDACKDDAFLDIYAERTGISRATLEAHRAQRWAPLLPPTHRNAYCPMCFQDDLLAGNTPYFRLDWARIFLTHCRKHRCPLFDWHRSASDGTRTLPPALLPYAGPSRTKSRQDERLQIHENFALANDYSSKSQRINQRSKAKWDKLMSFEENIYDKDIFYHGYAQDGAEALSERNLVKRAALLQRTAFANGHFTFPREVIPDEKRLLLFRHKGLAAYKTAPTSRALKPGSLSIIFRRSIIFELLRMDILGMLDAVHGNIDAHLK
jgi:hypothetical protein